MTPPPDDGRPGVPGFPTWGRVYAFVGATFLAWLLLLGWLTQHYA